MRATSVVVLTSLVVSPRVTHRLAAARAWLHARGTSEPLLVVATTLEAAAQLARESAVARGAVFGWQRFTLGRLAASLAARKLAALGLATAGSLVIEALCARVVHELAGSGALGRFMPVADRPGLVRAVARTVKELRLAGHTPRALEETDPDLARILSTYEQGLHEGRLADRASVLSLAHDVAREVGPPWGFVPVLFLDAPLASALEGRFSAALVPSQVPALATLPLGDARSLAHFTRAHGIEPTHVNYVDDGGGSSLARVQSHLFDASAAPHATLGDDVVLLSAPGESRECVEIARRIHREAEGGIPFDRMAVLLRAPAHYRPHLEEAFRRGGIPAHFTQGTLRPDPAGRAMLALLACAAEGLSARRFAEYLSLGQVPSPTEAGEPPAAASSESRFVPPDEELVPDAIARAAREPVVPDAGDLALPAPRKWERLLVEAAVIGGRDRWERRLQGLRNALLADLDTLGDPDDPLAMRLRADLDDLESLRAFALPLLAELDAFPELATWGDWIDRLGALATRALRAPQRVIAALAELAPMASIGAVRLHDVRLVLATRLRDLVVAPPVRKPGKVLVADAESARGLAFEVVFVPGLAEKLFPQKVVEDPILRDEPRRVLDLDDNEQCVAAERLALRIAVGAATQRVVLSYPRVDTEQGRPRVPSFYGLEILRAAEGKLTGFDELARRVERGAATRLGWPAPESPTAAIDEAEHDLALLASLLHKSDAETKGTARYLLSANPHLERALRARARRWFWKLGSADGLVDPPPEALAALGEHKLSARSYSPTALQHFAACPYRFLLQAIQRLAPRELPEAIEELDPLQRGSLVHAVQFALLDELRAEGLLPIPPDALESVSARLDAVVDRVAERFHDDLAPAIDRVWDDGIASIRADAREWIKHVASSSWVPHKFELSFGMHRARDHDPGSTVQAAALDVGIQLRGSIDLVERSATGTLRATDYKTGKARAKQDAVIGGGETLQPVLYALALEKLVPDAKVEGGRLWYCTSAGEFTEVIIPLDAVARASAAEVAGTIGQALDQGFLPAAPARGACEYCDYLPVCGPNEEHRVSKKRDKREPLLRLRKLREMP